jgi:dephospho-CoA kinase
MANRSPFLIGITGNIACGKSLVSTMLAEFGAEVIDADHVAHEIMTPGSDVLRLIADRFGDHVLNQDGSLARQTLGQIVFSDPAALADLERITHPPTVQTILERASESTSSVVVIDAIKLFEAGLADHCHQNWVVYCDARVQRQRLMERNGLTVDQAQQRIDAQPPQEEKVRRADAVIDNSGSISETRTQVTRVWEQITSRTR